MICTYSITSTSPAFFPCEYKASIAINVPVRPPPALQLKKKGNSHYTTLQRISLSLTLIMNDLIIQLIRLGYLKFLKDGARTKYIE